jgi:precorrin-6Y C5,15-methyltransferase (decarboxylating)
MLAHPAMRAIAIEANAERAERIGRNAAHFGVPGLRLVTGFAPAVLEGLPQPDAIFVGGGGSDAGVMAAAIAALKPGGRLVANAVTLEMEAVLLAHQARLGGSLVRIDVARAAPVGGMQGWRPAMPVTQWAWVKKD